MGGTRSECSFDPILCTLGVLWAKSKKKYFWPPVHGKLQVRASLHSGHKFPVFVLRIIKKVLFSFFEIFQNFEKYFFRKFLKCVFRRLKCVKESKHGYLESNEYTGCFCGLLCEEGWPFFQTWFWALTETPSTAKNLRFSEFFFPTLETGNRKKSKKSPISYTHLN